MSNLISRSALLEEFKKCHISFNGTPMEKSDMMISYRSLARVINKQQTVEAKPVEWIPCSERLPEESGYYLATIENAKFPQILHYLKGYKRWRDEFSERKYVVAWQPLPTPYNEKRGGKNE